MKIIMTLLGLLLLCGTAHAEVYKWVDDKGQVHYGDHPKGGGSGEVAIDNKPEDASPSADSNKHKTEEVLKDMEKSRKQKEKAQKKKYAAQQKQDEKCLQEQNKIRKLEAKMQRDYREFSNDRSDSYKRAEAEVADRRKYIEQYCR